MISFPVEYQDWVLLVITFGFFFSLVFPMWLAGLPYASARRVAAQLQRRLMLFYVFALAANFMLLSFVLALLPDWDWGSYLTYVWKGGATASAHISVFASSGLVLLGFLLLYMLKDRFKILLGIEDIYLFRFSWKECWTCFGSNSRAIEVYLYKVEELSAGNMIRANDVYVEMLLGLNERVRTRVHKQAGSGAVLKECLQLNYDPDDDEEKLIIMCMNQDVLVSSSVGQLEFSNKDINQIIDVNDVQQFRLYPQGKMWLSISYVDDEEAGYEVHGARWRIAKWLC